MRVWWGCVFVKSRLYDDSFETEKTCSVHLTLEASSPHLVARQPLGRVEEDFSASGFFPMWLFFGGGGCFSLFAVYFCDQ